MSLPAILQAAKLGICHTDNQIEKFHFCRALKASLGSYKSLSGSISPQQQPAQPFAGACGNSWFRVLNYFAESSGTVF